MLNLPGFLIEPKLLAIPPQTKDLFVYVKENKCLIHSWFYMATRLLLDNKQLNAIERLFRIFLQIHNMMSNRGVGKTIFIKIYWSNYKTRNK